MQLPPNFSNMLFWKCWGSLLSINWDRFSNVNECWVTANVDSNLIFLLWRSSHAPFDNHGKTHYVFLLIFDLGTNAYLRKWYLSGFLRFFHRMHHVFSVSNSFPSESKGFYPSRPPWILAFPTIPYLTSITITFSLFFLLTVFYPIDLFLMVPPSVTLNFMSIISTYNSI